MFSEGDLVVIINDANNYIYKIREITDKVCLIGYSYRLVRYVDISEIRLASIEEVNKENNVLIIYQPSIHKSVDNLLVKVKEEIINAKNDLEKEIRERRKNTGRRSNRDVDAGNRIIE